MLRCLCGLVFRFLPLDLHLQGQARCPFQTFEATVYRRHVYFDRLQMRNHVDALLRGIRPQLFSRVLMGCTVQTAAKSGRCRCRYEQECACNDATIGVPFRHASRITQEGPHGKRLCYSGLHF